MPVRPLLHCSIAAVRNDSGCEDEGLSMLTIGYSVSGTAAGAINKNSTGMEDGVGTWEAAAQGF